MDQKSHINATVERYFDMWNETDPAQRRAIIEEVWTPEAQSLDPIAAVTGCASPGR